MLITEIVCALKLAFFDLKKNKYSLKKLKDILDCVEYIDKNCLKELVYEKMGSQMLGWHKFFLKYEIDRLSQGSDYVKKEYPRVSYDSNYWYDTLQTTVLKTDKKTFKRTWTDLKQLPDAL